MSRRRRAGRLLVELYPSAWRARYGEEVLALLEDDPPSLRGVLSLLMGAADAHLRPQSSWSATASPLDRIRLSLGGMFCCWIVLAVVGVGFQKATEDPTFFAAARSHHLLEGARDTIVAGAALGALAIAIGGLPLLWQALAQARASREKGLIGLLMLPLVALGGFAALTGLLLALAPASGDHSGAPAALLVLGPWWLGGLACACVCAIAPRLVLRRVASSASALRRAALTGVLLVIAMILITSALVVYDAALVLQAPSLSAQGSGPIGVSTGATLAVGALAAAVATALGAIGAARAARARTSAPSR
jgi:hypothetical protein